MWAAHANELRILGRPFFVPLILAVHVSMLIYSAFTCSPVLQEYSVVGAGVYHWETGRFDHFRVNPPFIRLVATLPIYLQNTKSDWSNVQDHFWSRTEIAVGEDFFRSNPDNWQLLLFSARFVCILFSIAGSLCCRNWARDEFGEVAGNIALTLWCFSPIILGHAYLVTGDIQTTTLVVITCRRFYLWIANGGIRQACWLGVFLGLTICSKSTTLVLIPVFIVACIIISISHKDAKFKQSGISRVLGLAFVFTLSYWILLACYCFQNVGVPLKDYQFVSRLLGGHILRSEVISSNRFSESLFATLPVPLPEDYVLGIDLQKRDFEIGRPCYILGTWRETGVWWYYLVGLAVKSGGGTLPLFFLSFCLFSKGTKSGFLSLPFVLSAILPLVALLVLVSFETGLNEHLRYGFPVLPFIFILAARTVAIAYSKGKILAVIASMLIFVNVSDGIRSYPNSIAFNNYLGESLSRDKPPLLGSSLDWGQDTLKVEQFYHENIKSGSFGYAFIRDSLTKTSQESSPTTNQIHMIPEGEGRSGGNWEHLDWVAISINRLYAKEAEFEPLRHQLPDAVIGKTTVIFQLRDR